MNKVNSTNQLIDKYISCLYDVCNSCKKDKVNEKSLLKFGIIIESDRSDRIIPFSFPFPVVADSTGRVINPITDYLSKPKLFFKETENHKNRFIRVIRYTKKDVVKRSGLYKYVWKYFKHLLKQKPPQIELHLRIGSFQLTMSSIKTERNKAMKFVRMCCIDGLMFRFNDSQYFALDTIDKIAKRNIPHFIHHYIFKLLYTNMYCYINEHVNQFTDFSMMYLSESFLIDVVAITMIVFKLFGYTFLDDIVKHRMKECGIDVSYKRVMERYNYFIDNIHMTPINDYMTIAHYIITMSNSISSKSKNRNLIKLKVVSDILSSHFYELELLNSSVTSLALISIGAMGFSIEKVLTTIDHINYNYRKTVVNDYNSHKTMIDKWSYIISEEMKLSNYYSEYIRV